MGEQVSEITYPCAIASFGEARIPNLVTTGGLDISGTAFDVGLGCPPKEGDVAQDDYADPGLSGGIALAYRGTCTFENKATHVLARYAADAVVIVNGESD